MATFLAVNTEGALVRGLCGPRLKQYSWHMLDTNFQHFLTARKQLLMVGLSTRVYPSHFVYIGIRNSDLAHILNHLHSSFFWTHEMITQIKKSHLASFSTLWAGQFQPWQPEGVWVARNNQNSGPTGPSPFFWTADNCGALSRQLNSLSEFFYECPASSVGSPPLVSAKTAAGVLDRPARLLARDLAICLSGEYISLCVDQRKIVVFWNYQSRAGLSFCRMNWFCYLTLSPILSSL